MQSNMKKPRSLTLIPVAPIGKVKMAAFVDGPKVHGVREVEVDEYPPSAKGIVLRETRNMHQLSLRTAALMVELPVVEICGLENGKYTLSDRDFGIAMRRLMGLSE